MLRLLWTEQAEDDLAQIIAFISIDSKAAAQRLKERIERSVTPASEHPYMFRPGRVPGTREIIAHPNYIVVYRVAAEHIEVTMRRVLSAVPIALIAVTACFFILRLAPGGPFDGDRALPPDTLANLRAHYSLDQPLFMQYFIYVGRLLQGDFGPSMVYNDFTVSEMLGIGLPFTMMLGFSAFLVALVVGLIAGSLAAVNQNKWPDYVLVAVVMIGLVIPNFLMGLLLQLVFGVYLDWFPAGGYTRGSIVHLILPITVLALPQAGRIARLMRGSMIEVLGTNYVRTARSKGLGTRLILARHALKPALIPVVSYLGPGLAYLLTGSLVVEQIFALPGIGKYFISAALNRDYGLVLGTTILYMFIILALNLVVDILYAWLDPKVRYR